MSEGLEATGRHENTAEPSAVAPLEARINGAFVRYTGGTEAIHARLAALLRPFIVETGLTQHEPSVALLDVRLEQAVAERGWRIYVNSDFFTMAYDSAYLLPYLEWLAISRAVEQSRESVTFHAASLTRGEHTIILVAKSGSGKTTLTAGLAGRGWLPFSDDLTIVDLATRTISPFRRCFHADGYTREVIAEAIPTSTPDPELPDYILPNNFAHAPRVPTAVFLINRNPERPTNSRAITRADAAGALFTSAIRNAAPRSQVARLAADIASEVRGCWEINNSDLADTLDLIEQTLQAH